LPTAIQLKAAKAPEHATVNPAWNFAGKLTLFFVFSSKTKIAGVCLKGLAKATAGVAAK
jgi:hypothetical protein